MSEVDTSAERRFLIRKNGYYYRPNSEGYTSSAIVAGRYTMDEAESITHPNGPDGPRDGMSFIAEHICPDEDWIAHCKAISQARSDALEEAAQLGYSLPPSSMPASFMGKYTETAIWCAAKDNHGAQIARSIRAIKEATQEAP